MLNFSGIRVVELLRKFVICGFMWELQWWFKGWGPCNFIQHGKLEYISNLTISTCQLTQIYLYISKFYIIEAIFSGFRRKKTEKDSDIKPIHAHNQNPTVSRYAVPLFKNIPNCIPSQTNKLLKLHGLWTSLLSLSLEKKIPGFLEIDTL